MKTMIFCRACSGALLRQLVYEFCLATSNLEDVRGRIELAYGSRRTVRFNNFAKALELLFHHREITCFALEQKDSFIQFEYSHVGITLSFLEGDQVEIGSDISSKIRLVQNIVKHYALLGELAGDPPEPQRLTECLSKRGYLSFAVT